MPKNPDRPKIKYKHVKKPKPPLLTAEEKAARRAERAQRMLAKWETRRNISPAKVAKVILQERGLLTPVCRLLKIPRTTLLRYIDKHDECIEALIHAKEALGDKAEKKLHELIEAGDVRCILYYLSTVHRNRGYGLHKTADEESDGRGPVFVDTVNIVGVPSGTFLPKEIASRDDMVIDNVT